MELIYDFEKKGGGQNKILSEVGLREIGREGIVDCKYKQLSIIYILCS